MIALERHFRVKDLASLWGFSRMKITGLFRDEQGVLRIQDGEKGRRASLSIPESVVLRVHQRLQSLGNKSLQAYPTRLDPSGVILLGNPNRRVPQKARHVIKLKARQKLADSK